MHDATSAGSDSTGQTASGGDAIVICSRIEITGSAPLDRRVAVAHPPAIGDLRIVPDAIGTLPSIFSARWIAALMVRCAIPISLPISAVNVGADSAPTT